MGLWTRLLFRINWIIVLATLVAYLSPYISPLSFWPISFFGLFYPIFLIANIVFILFWSFQNLKYSLLSVITLIFGWSHLNSFYNINSTNIVKEAKTISIYSYNVMNARTAYDRNKEERKQNEVHYFNFLDTMSRADIICTQETGPYAKDLLKKKFKPFHTHILEDRGACIFTRHNIHDKGEIEFGTATNSCLWADVVIGIDTIRVYSVHLQSNNITRDADKVIETVNLQEKKTWAGIRGIMSKYKNSHIKRAKQSQLVAKHAESSPYPVIIAGDFNDPPQSFTYRTLCDDRNDAYEEKGSGLGTTYAGRIPLLRIDYILSDNEMDVIGYEIIKENHSDHFPIHAVLSMPSSK